MSDAHIIIGAAWCLAGYIAGAGAMVCLFWRRLSRPSAEEWRQREQALDDAGAQIRQLYEQNAALALRLADVGRAMRLAERHAVMSTREQVT